MTNLDPKQPKPIIFDPASSELVHGAAFVHKSPHDNINFVKSRGIPEGYSDELWCLLFKCTLDEFKTLQTENVDTKLFVSIYAATDQIDIIARLEDIFRPNLVGSWLMLPNPIFQNQRPVDLLANSEFELFQDILSAK